MSRRTGRAYGQGFGMPITPPIGRPVSFEEAATPIYGEGGNRRQRRALAAKRRKEGKGKR